MQEIAYLQHGRGTSGPFRTERVELRNVNGYEVKFAGRWCKACAREIDGKLEEFIKYKSERIALLIVKG